MRPLFIRQKLVLALLISTTRALKKPITRKASPARAEHDFVSLQAQVGANEGGVDQALALEVRLEGLHYVRLVVVPSERKEIIVATVRCSRHFLHYSDRNFSGLIGFATVSEAHLVRLNCAARSHGCVSASPLCRYSVASRLTRI